MTLSSTRRTLLWGLALVLVAVVYAVRIRTGMADFTVNYHAGARLAAGDTLYQVTDGHYMFKYLPSAALIYLPLALLPLEIAKAVWFAFLIAALWMLFRLVGDLIAPVRRPRVLLLSGLILAKYFLHELRLGQINIVVTVVMLLALRTLVRRPEGSGPRTAGTLSGIAVGLKPYAALLLPYLVIKRQWLVLTAALLTVAIALLVPMLFYGAGGNLDVLRAWASTLSESTPGLLTNNDNVSVVAFFAKWLGDPGRAVAPAAVVLGLMAAVMLAVIVAGGQARRSAILEWSLLLTVTPLISPLGWDYTFLMSLLTIALVLNHFDAFPRVARWILAANFVVIALAVYDIMGRQAYATFMQWSITTINFLIVFAAAAYLRFRRVC